MTKYFLVAVGHGFEEGLDDDRVMSVESAVRFFLNVAPLITNKSLLLCEAVNHPNPLSPSHEEYYSTKSWLFDNLLGETLPTLGGLDFRQEKGEETTRKYGRWREIVSRLTIEATKVVYPRSITETIEAVKGGTLTARLSTSPTKEEIEIASWVGATSRKFDRMYLEAMRKWGRHHDVCIFLGGAIHVVSMALKSGYPVIDLTLAPDDPMEGLTIYSAYLTDYVWSKLFR